MSRILRRPMFRGGRVSSYGKGIAAPLVPGYAGGGQIGGGIIYGKPMADGRYGFQEPTMGGIVTIQDILSITKAPMTGKQILDYATENSLNLGEDFKINPYSKYTPEKVTIGEGTENEREISWSEFISDKGMPEIYDKPYVGKGDKQGSEIEGVTDQVTAKTDATGKVIKDASGNIVYVGKAGDLPPPPPTKSNLELENEKLRRELAEALKGTNSAESIDIDKETYFKALGGDKARAADISNMLLAFAGAEGDDTMSKFKSFTASEAKRPSESKKLKEAAAMLAIKDNIAGKRADEQLAKILSMEGMRSKLGKKNLAEQISIAEKTLPMNSVAALKRGLEMWDEGSIVDVQPDANYEVGPEDEGNYIIESDTKTVYKIVEGKKKKIR